MIYGYSLLEIAGFLLLAWLCGWVLVVSGFLFTALSAAIGTAAESMFVGVAAAIAFVLSFVSTLVGALMVHTCGWGALICAALHVIQVVIHTPPGAA